MIGEKIKVAGDITVLPADNSGLKLNWVAYEMQGFEVFKSLEDADAKDIQATDGKHIVSSKALTRFHDLKIGDKVIVTHFFGRSWATVTELDEASGSGSAATDSCLFPMSFDKDERHCWVEWGMINKKCFSSLLGVKAELDQGCDSVKPS